MKYFYDTEFQEGGPDSPIRLLSIGMVSEDGREFYRETPYSTNTNGANDWTIKNVYPLFIHFNNRCNCIGKTRDPNCPMKTREEIARDLIAFVQDGGSFPEWWVYYGAYDHICLAQLFGDMNKLPNRWPYYSNDIVQYRFQAGIDARLPQKPNDAHNALSDAKWTRQAYLYLVDNDTGVRYVERRI